MRMRRLTSFVAEPSAVRCVLGGSLTRPEGPGEEFRTRRTWLCKGRGKPTLRQVENALFGSRVNGLAELRDLGCANLELVLVLNEPEQTDESVEWAERKN